MLNNGDVFAGFTIERLLGQGGMGSVYLARHPRLGRLTALKLLNRELFADREIRARFEREADLVAQLDHPNIVEVYDRGSEDEQLWISMQYIDGVDAAGVNVTQLPPERAVQIIEGVADALDYAHTRGVLHRDVKPANIILARAVAGHGERVFLTDFGIARLREDSTHLTQRGMFTATLAYASPEQMTGAHLDHTTDQYSLACALYWLLIGAGPYDSPHPAELIRGHLQLLPPPVSLRRPGLTQAMDAVLTKAMAKRPVDRFPSCADFAKAARRALTSGPVPYPVTAAPFTVAPPTYGAPPAAAYPAGPPAYPPQAPNYPPGQPAPGYAPSQPVPAAASVPAPGYSPAQPGAAAPVPSPGYPAPGVPQQGYPGAPPNYPAAPPSPPAPQPQQVPASPEAPLDDSAYRPTDSFPTRRTPGEDSGAEDSTPAVVDESNDSIAQHSGQTDSFPTQHAPLDSGSPESAGAAAEQPATSAAAEPDSPRAEDEAGQSEPVAGDSGSAVPVDGASEQRSDAGYPGAGLRNPESGAFEPSGEGVAVSARGRGADSVWSREGASREGGGSGAAEDGSPAVEAEARAAEIPPGGTQPPAGTQSPGGTQPPAGTQSPGGTQPPAGTQSPAGTQPPAGTQSLGGTQPPGGTQPLAESQPGVAPAAGATPTVIPPGPHPGGPPPGQFGPPGYPVNSPPPQRVPAGVGRSQVAALVVVGLAVLALLLLLAVVVVQVAG
ncbi:serine/threonine-protein kinase [Nocardia acidivorans]|uniref:serine/threonine-protein kinase n=1 Tax=Nocardia acidivorans TaxID=404580 RepID=UPI000AD73A43|nr:serine/threonine-protein kinase [Nocardia acidivorans]